MGVRCSCGVRVGLPFTGVAAVSEDNQVSFDNIGNRRGTITYTADVCADTLDTSTVTISFFQTSRQVTNLSFTGTSTEITSVECDRVDQNCQITVTGTIQTQFGTFPFIAEFRDQNPNANVDIVQVFDIDGFFNQQGAAPVAQGSIVNQGCAE
jgi:hypothetical protein